MLQAPGSLIPMGTSPWNKSGRVIHPIPYSFGQRFQQGRVVTPCTLGCVHEYQRVLFGDALNSLIKAAQARSERWGWGGHQDSVSLWLWEAGGSLHEAGCHCCVAGWETGIRASEGTFQKHLMCTPYSCAGYLLLNPRRRYSHNSCFIFSCSI